MSKYQDSILTTAGLQLASKAYAGKTTFKLTRTATTADVVAADEVKTLMVLPHEAQAGTITQGDSVVSDDHTLITTELLFTNKDLKTGYSINAIGVYALEAGSDKEILYSVAIAEQAEFMPDFADKVLMEFKAIITMAIGQISNVTIEMIANNLATQQYVQNAIGAVQIGGTNLIEDTTRTKNTVEVAAGETIVQRKNVSGAMEPGKYLCRVIIENTPCDVYMSVAVWKISTSTLERTVVGNTIKAGESDYSSVQLELGADEFIAYTYIMLNEVQPKMVSCSYRRWKLEWGNNYTDWSPSDADMARISLDGSITTYGGKYIPAKDSEVVHDNHNGTMQMSGMKIKPVADQEDGSIRINNRDITPVSSNDTNNIEVYNFYNGGVESKIWNLEKMAQESDEKTFSFIGNDFMDVSNLQSNRAIIRKVGSLVFMDLNVAIRNRKLGDRVSLFTSPFVLQHVGGIPKYLTGYVSENGVGFHNDGIDFRLVIDNGINVSLFVARAGLGQAVGGTVFQMNGVYNFIGLIGMV